MISSLPTTSAYTDTRLKEGTTHRYVVTATDRSSNESPYGNEASATVPIVALSFDGADDWVPVPSSGLLNQAATGERTYEALIKTGSDVSRRRFVREEGGDGNGLSVEVSEGGCTSACGLLPTLEGRCRPRLPSTPTPPTT